jgi:hypothetical protein
MGRETEPSFREIEASNQNFSLIEKGAKELLVESPDELVGYSVGHFGPIQRLIAIKACEKQIDFYHLIRRPEVEDEFLAVLPTLWALFDESNAE